VTRVAGLEFRHVTKSFGAVRALSDVSFSVAEGETHACVGENGAGKSTLLKILAGIVVPDAGEMYWHDERLGYRTPRAALERGIGMVYQEVLAFPNLSVSGNIFAGREVTLRGGRLDEGAMRARTCRHHRTRRWKSSRPPTRSSCKSRGRSHSTVASSCSTNRRRRSRMRKSIICSACWRI
jgi:ABC-type sugar transport system ATPase subunit